MSIMLKFLKSIGISKIKEVNPYNYKYENYKDIKNPQVEKLVQHKEFLKTLLDEERSRLGNIEAKTTQLISQTSLIISLASLFIPLLIDKSNDININVKFIFVFFLVATYLFYILTIINALKNYNVKKYNYASPSPENVLDYKDLTIDEFNEELIRDYLYSINENQKINNTKATNVLHSYNTFKIANILLSILVIAVCISSFFTKESFTKVEIKNAVNLKLSEHLKIGNKECKEPINIVKKDTIYVLKVNTNKKGN